MAQSEQRSDASPQQDTKGNSHVTSASPSRTDTGISGARSEPSDTRHLFKSRHGVWYYRLIVPTELRKRFPELPKELKRSTKTTQIRVARSLSKFILGQLVSKFNLGNADMSAGFEGLFGPFRTRPPLRTEPMVEGGGPGDWTDNPHNPMFSPVPSTALAVQRMVLERDPTTRRITRLETTPGDSEQALSLVKQLLDMEQADLAHTRAVEMAHAVAAGASAKSSSGVQAGALSVAEVPAEPICCRRPKTEPLLRVVPTQN